MDTQQYISYLEEEKEFNIVKYVMHEHQCDFKLLYNVYCIYMTDVVYNFHGNICYVFWRLSDLTH